MTSSGSSSVLRMPTSMTPLRPVSVNVNGSGSTTACENMAASATSEAAMASASASVRPVEINVSSCAVHAATRTSPSGSIDAALANCSAVRSRSSVRAASGGPATSGSWIVTGRPSSSSTSVTSMRSEAAVKRTAGVVAVSCSSAWMSRASGLVRSGVVRMRLRRAGAAARADPDADPDVEPVESGEAVLSSSAWVTSMSARVATPHSVGVDRARIRSAASSVSCDARGSITRKGSVPPSGSSASTN